MLVMVVKKYRHFQCSWIAAMTTSRTPVAFKAQKHSTPLLLGVPVILILYQRSV